MEDGLRALAGRKALAEEIAGLLSPASIKKALSDPHSWRRPRPCGLTIHPGFGCPNACLYCYVSDMTGGPVEPRVLGLSGLELALALCSNPYFVPGRMGTFLAMGAVCDPFHPALASKTLEIMEALASRLGNPVQFSTKMPIDLGLARRLPKGLPISPLVTIVSLERASELEPRAPPPQERLRTISNLRKAGLKPMLFLRPMIPGLLEHEAEELLSEAKRAGALGVVVGSLRVSASIMRRLAGLGLDGPVRARLKRGRLGGKLVPVPSRDLRELVFSIAREKGLLVFRSACCANAYVAGVPCADLCWARGFCTSCPNRCLEKLPPIEAEEVKRALRSAFGLDVLGVSDEGLRLAIEVRRSAEARGVLDKVKKALEVAARRLVSIRVV